MLKTSHTDFLLLQPADICAALFELTHPDSHILVRDVADREIAAVVVGVDKQTGYFFWRPRDYAGTHFARQRDDDIFTGTVFHFAATGYGGVRMHFRVPRPEIITFDDGSATYFSPMPERMSHVQRRNMFRVSLQGCPVKCSAAWMPPSATQAIHFSLRDISIEGIGLRCGLPVAALPRRGDLMRDVRLQFGDLGSLNVNLDVRNTYGTSGQQTNLDDTPGTPSRTSMADIGRGLEAVLPVTPGEIESHLGALIFGLGARDQVWLQQMVWRLEKMRSTGNEAALS